MRRWLRQTVRRPGEEVGNLFIPLFFLFVTVGAVGTVARDAFGVDDYFGFQIPVAVVQGVAGAASISGIVVVTDIEQGYFDKLLLTPVPRLALVIGRLLADAVRCLFFTAVILVVATIHGTTFEAGPLGYVVLLLLAALFGLAYSGIGLALALRTGSAQAANAGFLLFFPLLFLSPAFAPTSVFQPWLEFLANINPVTYILQGMRVLILQGWEWDDLAKAFLSAGGFAVVTVALSLLALRTRTA
jgi:ABC-2 type transport system permease protein